MLIYVVSDIQIQTIVKFDMTMSISTFLKATNFPTQHEL